MKYIKERTDYYNLHGDDDYNITKTVRDDIHDYEYCDGILYELSGSDTIVNIDEVEHTEGNMFYEDQIERYIEYFEDGGITQTFPVQTSPLGECYNLEAMLEYLEEPDNFDLAWDVLSENHRKLLDTNKFDIVSDPESFGFNDSMALHQINNLKDLNEAYNKDIMNNEDREGDYSEELYQGLVHILEYWKDAQEYTLTDFNHRFAAIKKMGKTMVMVDPS